MAAADGILLEVNVQEGFAVKSVGQTVAAGDVLVSAYKPDPYEQPVESHAKGLVVAAVMYAIFLGWFKHKYGG